MEQQTKDPIDLRPHPHQHSMPFAEAAILSEAVIHPTSPSASAAATATGTQSKGWVPGWRFVGEHRMTPGSIPPGLPPSQTVSPSATTTSQPLPNQLQPSHQPHLWTSQPQVPNNPIGTAPTHGAAPPKSQAPPKAPVAVRVILPQPMTRARSPSASKANLLEGQRRFILHGS